jgi:hypothetical protein
MLKRKRMTIDHICSPSEIFSKILKVGYIELFTPFSLSPLTDKMMLTLILEIGLSLVEED